LEGSSPIENRDFRVAVQGCRCGFSAYILFSHRASADALDQFQQLAWVRSRQRIARCHFSRFRPAQVSGRTWFGSFASALMCLIPICGSFLEQAPAHFPLVRRKIRDNGTGGFTSAIEIRLSHQITGTYHLG